MSCDRCGYDDQCMGGDLYDYCGQPVCDDEMCEYVGDCPCGCHGRV